MRKKRAKQELAALGYTPFEPTAEQRHLVKVLRFNGVPEARIATCVGVTLVELEYLFARELGFAVEEIQARAAARVLSLIDQQASPEVALRASLHVLQAGNRNWRIPKQEEAPAPERIADMSLADVEREIAILERRGREKAAAAEEEATATARPAGSR